MQNLYSKLGRQSNTTVYVQYVSVSKSGFERPVITNPAEHCHAVIVMCRVGSQSVVYTGDYNMTPDRHLGSAWIDKCRPDLLITGTGNRSTGTELGVGERGGDAD